MSERAWSIAPYFLVDDVITTANFYRDRLGFSYSRFWGDPPRFCMVQRAGIVIMLSQAGHPAGQGPNRLLDPEGAAWDVYVWLDDADALYQEYARQNVKIVRGLCNQEYNVRDFEIEDCNGFRLCFGHPL